MLVHSLTAEETEDFGARVACAWPQRDRPFAVVYLTGDLGAGKTTLARGFLRALGVVGAVRSPTYTLVEIYETSALTALHLDLYRLTDPAELDNLGLREWAKEGHVWLIEWPERGSDRLPPADLDVRLTAADGHGTDGHAIEVNARTDLGRSWLAHIVENAPGAS
jgi:tRNA threonylcarbamoyladenosine biosynthesis protein TsaE